MRFIFDLTYNLSSEIDKLEDDILYFKLAIYLFILRLDDE